MTPLLVVLNYHYYVREKVGDMYNKNNFNIKYYRRLYDVYSERD